MTNIIDLRGSQTGFNDVADVLEDGNFITDLSSGTPASDDQLVISDTSSSGESKKITINNLLSAFSITETDYTPTIAVNSGAGTFTSTTIQYAKYAKIGNLVIFWVHVTGTVTGTVNRISATRPSTASTALMGSGDAIDTGGFTYGGYTTETTTILAVGKADRSAIAAGTNAGVKMWGAYLE